MLTFSKILTEEKLYYERNGKLYGKDSSGKEFEITPKLAKKYYDKYGGAEKLLATSINGGFLTGLGACAAGTIAYGHDPDLTIPAMAGTGLLGSTGILLLARNQIENDRNDIVRKRMEKKI